MEKDLIKLRLTLKWQLLLETYKELHDMDVINDDEYIDFLKRVRKCNE